MRDVTELVKFYNPEGGSLPLVVCVCGKQYPPFEFQVKEDAYFGIAPQRCDSCGRAFQFEIRVYEV